jgi:hypothetical protein
LLEVCALFLDAGPLVEADGAEQVERRPGEPERRHYGTADLDAGKLHGGAAEHGGEKGEEDAERQRATVGGEGNRHEEGSGEHAGQLPVNDDKATDGKRDGDPEG